MVRKVPWRSLRAAHQRAPTGVLADARGRHTLQSTSAADPRVATTTRRLTRGSAGRRPMVGRVRQLVPRPAGRGDLVRQPGDVHALPRRLVRPVLRQPRAPSPARFAAMAHHPRRRPTICGCNHSAAGNAAAHRDADREDRPPRPRGRALRGRDRARTLRSRHRRDPQRSGSRTLERPVSVGTRDPRRLPIPTEHGGVAHRRAHASTSPARLGELELPPSGRRRRSRRGDVPHEPASEHPLAPRDLRHTQPRERDQTGDGPRDDPLLASGLRPRSPSRPSSGTPRSAGSGELRTAGPTGDTASTKMEPRARNASAPSWESAGEQCNLRRHRLSPTRSACSPRIRAAGRAPAARPRRSRRGLLAPSVVVETTE